MTRVNGRSPLAVPKHTRNAGRGGIWSPRWWDRGSFVAVLALTAVGLVLGGSAVAQLRRPTVIGTVVRCEYSETTGRGAHGTTTCLSRWTYAGEQHEDDVEVPRWIDPGGPVRLLVDGNDALERHEMVSWSFVLIPGVLGLLSLVLFGYPPRRT